MSDIFKKLIAVFIITILPAGFLYAQVKADKIWITTKLSEKYYDKEGNILTGKGVVVGDVDSGIDIFHPMFFFADGGEYNWIDVNGDGKFEPGKDAVDLNKNGKDDRGEILNYIDLRNETYLIQSDPKVYEPDMDFLYVDRNLNGKRDFGEKDGFTEADPTYGEQFFITRDANGNNKLDVGEKLNALQTSKVRAVREKSGTIRRRGVDLIKTEPDSIGHGTGVSGILLGGHYGVQKLHGIAPDAEIVMANIKYNYTPRFVTSFPEMLTFLRTEGINILLFEDGEWMYEYMDGSTEEEELTNEIARSGITVIGGGGNLADGNMHIKDTIPANVVRIYNFSAPKEAEGKKNDGAFISFLWRQPELNISFKIKAPDGTVTSGLKDGSEFMKSGKYNIYYERSVSPKGTVMFKIGISEKDSGTVNGDWSVEVVSPGDVILDGFIVDVTQSWGGSTRWKSDKITGEGTVTFPCTADSCMAIGAYTVNYEWPGYGKLNDLCSYSGIGYNINGKMGIDLCAPGHTTFTTSTNYGYGIFSGTSSAAPHVVGAAILMLQYDKSLTHTQIRNILLATTTRDEFTGSVPNTNWGFGKLNTEAAIKYLMK